MYTFFLVLGPYLASQPLDNSLLSQTNLIPPPSQPASALPPVTANAGNPNTPSSAPAAPTSSTMTATSTSAMSSAATTANSTLTTTATSSSSANVGSGIPTNKPSSFPSFSSMNNTTSASLPTQAATVQNGQTGGQQQQPTLQAAGMSADTTSAPAQPHPEVSER